MSRPCPSTSSPPKSSDHRPKVQAKLAHDSANLHVFFRVEDRYVRSEHVGLHVPVCTDSCVEFFVCPRPDKGYLNFEMNAGGSLLLFYIEDHTRTPEGFRKFTKVPADLASQVKIRSSLPQQVLPEITEPTTWTLQAMIPLSLLEHYVGQITPIEGQQWRVNLFKCGDNTSHPHWASWSNLEGQFNFHLPDKFGTIKVGS